MKEEKKTVRKKEKLFENVNNFIETDKMHEVKRSAEFPPSNFLSVSGTFCKLMTQFKMRYFQFGIVKVENSYGQVPNEIT